MFKSFAGAALLALAAATASSAAFAGQGTQKSQDAREQVVTTFFEHFYAGRFDAALRAIKGLDFGKNNPEGTAIVTSMRSAALLGLKRKSEAVQGFAEADRLASDNPMIANLQYEAGLLTDHLDVAAQALDRLVARFPDEARQLPPRGVYWLLREEKNKQVKDQRMIALAQIGYGGEAQGDGLASSAIATLLDQGKAATATELVRYVDEPQVIEDMLILRRYSAIWPLLEVRAGPGLERVRASAVATAERELAEDPGNSEKLALLANALRHARRHADAIALQSKLPATPAAMATADEYMGWTVNNIALALHELGRGDEADQLFARLNDADMPKDQGSWRISMIINRLELLVADGKFDRAAQLLDRTEASAKVAGSPYAQQLVRRLRYCTYAGLGRKADAASLMPDLLKHAKDARHATVDALLCGREFDQAERLVLEGIEDDEFHGQLVRALQPKPLTSDDPSVWAGHWLELRKRPAVAVAYERLGRDMPERFVVPQPNGAMAKAE